MGREASRVARGQATGLPHHRRHMTAGQRAMAVAWIYPEPQKVRRKGSSPLEIKGLNAGRLSQARTVLAQGPKDLAPQVLNGVQTLDVAYATAQKMAAIPEGKL